LSFLAYLANSAFSQWLGLSMLGFPTLIALHSVGMGVVVGLTLMVALRLNGIIKGMPAPVVMKLLTIAVWGFLLNLVTGLVLFITRAPEYITAYIFLIKMLLVVISATIVFWLRDRLAPVEAIPAGSVDDGTARRMSVVATVTWFGAVVAGRLIAYLSTIYQ
jgi:hypothetical protein